MRLRPSHRSNRPRLRPAAALAALVTLAPVASAIGQDPARDWLEFPEGPMGRLWASVGAETTPWRPAVSSGDLGTDPHAWARWARAVDALDDPAGRRGAVEALAGLAARDGRVEDAYRWIAAFGAGDPEALAGSVPHLFPGFPMETVLGPGGRPAPLDEGVLLRPQLPPRSAAAVPGSIETRRATARRLVVGAATFDLMLKVDGSGVIAELTHVAGEAAELRVALPAPAGFRLKSVYVDWELQSPDEGTDPAEVDWAGIPLPVRVPPGDEPVSLFARLDRRDVPLPTAPAPTAPLPASLEAEGFLLVLADGERTARWDAMAGSLQSALGVPVRVAAPPLLRSRPKGPVPTALRFDLAPDPEALRRRITGAVEARLLE